MVVEIRLYKRFDTDLLALCDAGYSISAMMKEAVIGYANAYPVHFYMDELIPFDSNDKKMIHTRFIVPDSDKKTCYMLKHIKYRHRNSFCKAVLRNALVQQNLISFFADETLYQLQNADLSNRNLYMYQNLIPCSQMRTEVRQVSFLGNTISSQPKALPKTESPFFTSTISKQPDNPFLNSGYVKQQPMQAAVYTAPTMPIQKKAASNNFNQNKYMQTQARFLQENMKDTDVIQDVKPVISVSEITEIPKNSAIDAIKQDKIPVEIERTSAPSENIQMAEDDDLMNMFDAL